MFHFKKSVLTMLLILCTVLSALPVYTLANETSAQIVGQQLYLGDDLTMHFYGTVDSDYINDAVMTVTVGGTVRKVYNISDMTPLENGTYDFSVELGAPEMTEDIVLALSSGDATVLQKTYTIRDYAITLLNGTYSDTTKLLVKRMLNYGAQSQHYFSHNTEKLANVGYELENDIPVSVESPDYTVVDALQGISYHGASMLFESKTAVRFYFYAINNIDSYSFAVNNTPCIPVSKNGYYYIEASGITPNQMDTEITVTVSDGEGTLTLCYSPMAYISRMYHKDSTSVAMKNLLSAANQYFSAAQQFNRTTEFLLGSMTTEEKVGQLFLARCPDSEALSDISTYHLGGYVLFGKDFKYRTPNEVRSVIADYQEEAAIPLLIAVDEEGGIVTRVSSYSQFRSSKFPSPRNLYDQGGLALIAETEAEKCQLLKSLGINVNLAPVCDITTDPDAFMYSRSLGQSPEITGQFISTVLEVSSQNQLGNVLKHFPGYGNNTDTHTGIAVDNRSLQELESVDLVPFACGIDSGCGAIMVSHTFVNCLDTQYPASVSPAVHNYLRNDMGFDGVIVTDDLVMEAITDLYGAGEAAVLAVLAGNDLLCSTEYQTQYEAVLQAVNSGRISQSQLNQAVLRVLQWKYDLGLLSAYG